MIDPERILGGLVRQGLRSGLRGRRRSRRSGMGSLLGTGFKGAVGLGILGVAIAAFDHYTQSRNSGSAPTPPPAPVPSPESAVRSSAPPPPPNAPATSEGAVDEGASRQTPPPLPETVKQQALLLTRAMVAAANADGRIDAYERKAILGRLAEAGLGDEDRSFVLKELEAPSSVEDILSSVETPELARQVYAVSLLAIDVDTPEERDYLHYLRLRLGLDDRVAAELHRQLGLDETL